MREVGRAHAEETEGRSRRRAVSHRPTKPPENCPHLETLWAMCYLSQDVIRPRRHAYARIFALCLVRLDSYSIGRNTTVSGIGALLSTCEAEVAMSDKDVFPPTAAIRFCSKLYLHGPADNRRPPPLHNLSKTSPHVGWTSSWSWSDRLPVQLRQDMQRRITRKQGTHLIRRLPVSNSQAVIQAVAAGHGEDELEMKPWRSGPIGMNPGEEEGVPAQRGQEISCEMRRNTR
jgi:hypothetical protein